MGGTSTQRLWRGKLGVMRSTGRDANLINVTAGAARCSGASGDRSMSSLGSGSRVRRIDGDRKAPHLVNPDSVKSDGFRPTFALLTTSESYSNPCAQQRGGKKTGELVLDRVASCSVGLLPLRQVAKRNAVQNLGGSGIELLTDGSQAAAATATQAAAEAQAAGAAAYQAAVATATRQAQATPTVTVFQSTTETATPQSGSVSPPSVGDAGLLQEKHSDEAWAPLALAAAFALGAIILMRRRFMRR